MKGYGSQALVHPSYQAWSYAALLENYDANVQDIPITLSPCSYLFNYLPDGDDVLRNHVNNRFYDDKQEYAVSTFLFEDWDLDTALWSISRHGFVPLDAKGEVLAPVKLWCDTSTFRQCQELTDALGGPENVYALLGNQILPGYTASKVLALRENHPEVYVRLAHGVRKVFKNLEGKETVALNGVDLDIYENEFVCVVGPSGCGKSTLLSTIAGLEQASSGTVSINGEAIIGPGNDRGVVFQQYALFPWLTVRQNIEFGLAYLKKNDAETHGKDSVDRQSRRPDPSGGSVQGEGLRHHCYGE